MQILIVEDEERLVHLLRRGLREEGHTVLAAFDGADCVELATRHNFDAILLDIMMPRMDGYQVAQLLRSHNVSSAIIMLTAKDSTPDIVKGLDVGADDYLTKPFSFEELLARLHAVQRRVHASKPAGLQVGDLFLDPVAHRVTRAEASLSLTRTEYALLERLICEAGHVVHREALAEAIWGSGAAVQDNRLDALVRLLRRKVELQGSPRLIHTVRGVGYAIGILAESR
jgi:DNA-binding response OmpR family regulator